MSVEVVAKNTCSTVGEGPHWDDVNQILWYVDIKKGDIHRWHYKTGKDEVKHISDDPVAIVVPCKKGGYMISCMESIAKLDWETNTMTKLHQVEAGMSHRFNDGKCDASGRFWAGTMPLVPPGKNAFQLPKEESGLYSVETDGSIQKRLDKVCLSNGLGWSPDNRVMYFIDTPLCEVSAFDFDLKSGNMSNKRVVWSVDSVIDGVKCFPDGMTVDCEGKLWVAVYNSGKVFRIDPATGKELTSVTLPGQMETTSCCFGGKDYSELFVTCADVQDPAKKAQQPNAGSLFKVTGLGVKGLPGNMYGC